jgi:hypothetical protein
MAELLNNLNIYTQTLLPTKPERYPDMALMSASLLDLLEKEDIQGARTVTAHRMSFPEFPGRESVIALIGEVHTNPDRCPSTTSSKDMVLDVVLHYLRAIEPCVLILETFFHLESPNKNVMEDILHSMSNHEYPLSVVRKCLGKEPSGGCVYSEKSNALVFLRMIAAIAKTLATSSNVDEDLEHFSKRIMAIDPREDFNMENPFEMKAGTSETEKAIIRSLARLTPDALSKFLLPIDLASWSSAFTKIIWDPFFVLCRQTAAAPTLEAYTHIFLQVPDVIAMSRIFSILAYSLRNKNTLPIIIVYVGDTHREAIDAILPTIPVWTTTRQLHRSDPKGGSCIQARL